MAIDFVYFADLNPNGSTSPKQQTDEVCIPNISPRERRKRLRFAIQQFVITLVILGGMVALHLNPLWRLFLQFLFSAATVSYFQALDKT